MRFSLLAPAVAGLATLVPCVLEAQDRTVLLNSRTGVYVTGRVVDQSSGRSLAAAHVVFAEPGPEGEVVWQGVSRANGQFEIEELPRGVYEIRVSLLSFIPLAHQTDLSENVTMDFQIEMAPAALELDPVVVTALRRTRLEMSGFYERRETGMGITLTRASETPSATIAARCG